MKIIIWIAMTLFTSVLAYEGKVSNNYTEALLRGPWQSVQDYVTIRPGAHMFYWLYYADGTSENAQCKPLIIWLQGGPGYAASGIANFLEIGPLNLNMEPRKHTWVKGRNVLLLDHPVGTGFSYVRDDALLAKTDEDMAKDLFIAVKEFFNKHKELFKTPTYIFGQGYSGQICPLLAWYLHEAIQTNDLEMNLKGIGIGSGFVDPMEYIPVNPEYLYNGGIIDQNTYLDISAVTKMKSYYIDQQNYSLGAEWDLILTPDMNEVAGMWVNLDNVKAPSTYYSNVMNLLQSIMNEYVKPTLAHVVGRDLQWRYKSTIVHESFKESMLIPSTMFLETLLNNSKLKVAIYNGNLDVIAPLAGAWAWVHKLNWHGTDEFNQAPRQVIRGTNNGLYKASKQLSLWWVFVARPELGGHWVRSVGQIGITLPCSPINRTNREIAIAFFIDRCATFNLRTSPTVDSFCTINTSRKDALVKDFIPQALEYLCGDEVPYTPTMTHLVEAMYEDMTKAIRNTTKINFMIVVGNFNANMGIQESVESVVGVKRHLHGVPEDNPEAMEHILEHLISDNIDT